MNEVVPDSKLTDLERRVDALEAKVSSLPPPVDPTQAPSLKDISLPIPNVDTIVSTAKTTWALVEVFADIKLMLWMLVDRRYHMGWMTRLAVIGLVIAYALSYVWAPLAGYDNFVSRMIDKGVGLVICLILFVFLMFETRRYKAWRGGQT